MGMGGHMPVGVYVGLGGIRGSLFARGCGYVNVPVGVHVCHSAQRTVCMCVEDMCVNVGMHTVAGVCTASVEMSPVVYPWQRRPRVSWL